MTKIDVAERYYGALRGEGGFDDVPMADGLTFRSPTGQIEGAVGFHTAVGGLATRVQGLEIRHQAVDRDCVLSVYDLDLGMPGGPIPMAEVLAVTGGEIADVELLFDSPLLAGGAKS